VRAYESAAQSIKAHGVDLGKLTVKELQQIEGVGKSTAEKIRELIETGKVAKLEGLRAKHPPAVVALLRIQGLGRRRSSGCAPSWASARSTICAACWPSTSCAT
jgi:DNA polymerase (family 10)